MAERRVGIVRRVGDSGRIVIPKFIRDQLGIDDKVEWFMNTETGEAIIRPIEDRPNEKQMKLL